jgi:hypothetical protein
MVAFAGCADLPGGSQPHVTSASLPVLNFTPIPTIPTPAVHSITIGSFLADRVIPNDAGLLLAGSPGPNYQGPGPTGEPALYFYNFASQRIKTLAIPTPAPDGALRGIPGRITAGHWIVYSIADADNAHWSIHAVNTPSGENRLINSYIDTT